MVLMFGIVCRKWLRCILGNGDKMIPLIGDKVAAAFPCLNITLVTQDFIGVFYSDYAGKGFLGQGTLGGQLVPVLIDAVNDVGADLQIQLHIGALPGVVLNCISHLVI